MNPDQLSLEDIITPVGVSWWPPAIGWWLLALLIIAIAVALFIGIKKYRQKWGYRNQALSLLQAEYSQWQQQQQSELSCQNMCELLKRTAVSAYQKNSNHQTPDKNIAALHGQDWINFLNQQVKASIFTDKLADIICRQQYQSKQAIDIELLYRGCKQWVRQHSTNLQREAA